MSKGLCEVTQSDVTSPTYAVMRCSAPAQIRTQLDRISFVIRTRAIKMGFRVELFIDPVDDSLKCDLCSEVFREPVVTSCGHIYCVACLRLWMSKRGKCPRSCKQISFEKDVTRLLPLQNLVDRLKLRCANHGRGCQVVLAVRDMLEHMETCEYATNEESSTTTTAAAAAGVSYSDRVVGGQPEVNGFSQVLVCKNGCGLPLLFQDSTGHDCVKALQAQVSSLQGKLTRSEHDKEKISQRLVKREECMQERFTLLERELRAYQEQTLNFERLARDQRSQVRYLRRQLDNCGEQITEESELTIVLERHGGTLGFNIRGGTEEEDGQCGIYVSKIVDNSPAAQQGKLQLFDRILQIDDVDLRNASHQEAVKAFKNADDSLSITVKRLYNPDQDMVSSTSCVSIGVQTETIESNGITAQLTCCRCNGSNRSSQEFSSQGGINFIHQREDSGVDETGEHPSDIELHNGCNTMEQKKPNTDYPTTYCNTSNVTKCDDILNKLLLNSSLAALDRRSSRILLSDMNQRSYEDNSELHSLSNGYYSGNLSQASLENVKQTTVENSRNGSLDRTSNVQGLERGVEDIQPGYGQVNETDQLYFDSELEYEYEEITIGIQGRKSLGMTLFSGDGDDANSVFVNEVDPRSVVGKDGRVIEGDQILKIHDVAVTCLSDAVDLLSEERDEIKFLVARPVAELQATLLGAESDHGEGPLDKSRFHLEAFPIGVIEEEDEDEVETVIGDKCEKDSGVGRTDESLKNDESSEQDVTDEQQPKGTAKEQHKAQMDALGQQIIHFTACASTARELSVRDSPREKSSDEHSQRSGEREKRESKSSKHSSRRTNTKNSSDENTHSSGHEKKSGTKPHKSQKSSKSGDSSSRSKEKSELKDKEAGDKSERRRKKERPKDTEEPSRSANGSRVSKENRTKSTGHETSNENGEMKTEWRVRRNKDGSRIFISKKMKPAKQKLLRERAQKLAEERRGMTTDDETQSVYLGRYWSREDRRRQLDKVREARRTKKMEVETDKKQNGNNTKRNDFAIIELTQKKMASMDRSFDDFITVEEILRQRNRMGLSNGPVFVTTV